MQPSHRVWLAGHGDGPWPCWRCQEPVTQLGGHGTGKLGGRRRNGIIHHDDGNHGNDDPGNLRVMHHGCHATHHLRRRTHGGIRIDLRSPVPSWRQLANAIAAGEYRPDDPIPSLRTLQQETGLAMATVQHAISVLRTEGLVYSVSGRGTFVAPRQ